jgi:hypothetical protein
MRRSLGNNHDNDSHRNSTFVRRRLSTSSESRIMIPDIERFTPGRGRLVGTIVGGEVVPTSLWAFFQLEGVFFYTPLSTAFPLRNGEMPTARLSTFSGASSSSPFFILHTIYYCLTSSLVSRLGA